ncbi:hypothetical protein [Streptomyces pacificus]|uniref:Uncharacterized protein n=1 Tax=Streptomyces pacificus TaxID=2705029 RepID=A0A6A0AYV4_9ACTN|nr:hypothetical protein [Streptomyces pacificus]GFH37678.1 hypothetical protein SCWH03_39180 [Streptomyces pacificus]
MRIAAPGPSFGIGCFGLDADERLGETPRQFTTVTSIGDPVRIG